MERATGTMVAVVAERVERAVKPKRSLWRPRDSLGWTGRRRDHSTTSSSLGQTLDTR